MAKNMKRSSKTLQELQTSENLKKQAEELTIGYKFENWEHVDQPRTSQAKKSSRVDCTCYINICWSKTDSNPRVTTFEPEHANHTLNLVTSKFAPLYRSLPKPVLDRISFYINNSPGIEKDIVNAIQRFKQENTCNEANNPDNDAFLLLDMLENRQNEDTELYIAKKINNGRLFHIFWMDSNQPYNSLNKVIFEARWNQLIESFPSTNSYLMETLDKIKESWAKAFICIFFTAGMVSTQHVEGINGIIKKYVNSQSSLVDFFQGIQTFLHNQTTKSEYYDWMESLPYTYTTTSASQRIFPRIIEELKNNLHQNYVEQENNQDIDDQADRAQISLNSLVNKVNRENICEVWHILDNSKTESSLTRTEQAFMDINGNFSYIDISQSPTVLDILRNEGPIDDINLKFTARHLNSDPFGLGRKIAQVATEKRRFDVLEVFDQILEELHEIDENMNESREDHEIKDLRVPLKPIKALIRIKT
ncbi:17842_t:CDS:2 [Gigaspora rosea]|nr:17842_t:CDS:2 [Gigaspora rosea]